MNSTQFWSYISNAEYISFTANFVHAVLWILLIYLVSTATKSAFLTIVKIGLTVYAIHTLYIFNKSTTMSKIYQQTVVTPLEQVKIEEKAVEVGSSFWTAMSWGYAKIKGE